MSIFSQEQAAWRTADSIPANNSVLEVLNAITDAANTRGVAVEHPPIDVCTCSTTRSASIKQALVAAVTKCHTSVTPKAITVSPHNDCVSAKGGPLERNLQAGIVLAAYALFLGGCAAGPESETGETPPPSEEHEVFQTDLGKAEILTDNLEAPWSVALFHDTAIIESGTQRGYSKWPTTGPHAEWEWWNTPGQRKMRAGAWVLHIMSAGCALR